jgi:PadR family transcriptional regulator, regulatory protein PadR
MKKELVAASAEPLILALLLRGESYGYAIIQAIRAQSSDQIEWMDGMLYPVLHRMERNKWIKSRWVEVENGRKRKYYTITTSGKKALSEQQQDWMTVHATLTSLLKGSHV